MTDRRCADCIHMAPWPERVEQLGRMTEEQMRDVTGGRTNEWLRELCIILGKTIREIGDEFGIVSGGEES